MARAKKKPHEVADRRNGAPLVLVSSDEVVVPEFPTGLRAPGKEAWTTYWTSPMAQVATDADKQALTRYCKALDELATAQREMGRQRLVEGSQGQPRLNPLAAWIQSRESVITQLEDRLGLTPLARMRLGIATGEAHRSLAEMNQRMTAEAIEAVDSGDDDWDTFDAEVVAD